MPTEIATLGGGCFWCLEAVYNRMRGVKSVASGYMGGRRPNPTYEQVCSGSTGHVEVVQLEFDTGETNFREILDVFFAIHDPTTLNRQGNDIGTQYRSVIFYHSEEQKEIAREVMREVEGELKQPLTTAVEPAQPFYPAEAYHQEYFTNNPNQPYCSYVVAPKVAKFRQKFTDLLRDESTA